MLENLKKELENKGYTYKDLCALLNLSEKTIYSKINGKNDFTLKEICAIRKFIFPEFTFEYLFETN